jgi:nucleotide-binding universal stress UspA family protein
MTKIIVGVEDSDRSRDAVALAAALAKPAGALLLLACVYPSDAALGLYGDPEFDRRLREKTTAAVRRQLASLDGVDADIWALSGGSAATHLKTLAEQEGAALIVIGSSHRGDLGRVFAGTTAERLLHGSPCPVAVAPKGFADRDHDAVRTILVGYDGGAEAKVALAASLAAARVLSATVRVLEVLAPTSASALAVQAGAAFVIAPEQIERDVRESFEADIAALPDDVPIEAEFVTGLPVEELARRSADADLVILGSRGHGALAAVLLGSVSGRVVREAACPVVVIPRGVETHFEALFAAPATGVGA